MDNRSLKEGFSCKHNGSDIYYSTGIPVIVTCYIKYWNLSDLHPKQYSLTHCNILNNEFIRLSSILYNNSLMELNDKYVNWIECVYNEFELWFTKNMEYQYDQFDRYLSSMIYL